MASKDRVKIKLDQVEWDGLLTDIVNFMYRFRWFHLMLSSGWFKKLIAYDEKHNPCHSDNDESLAWRIICYLFPDCWCCSGIRGMLYGIILSIIVMLIWRAV